MPAPFLLAAAAIPALYKGIAGVAQGIKADNLSLRDTTPQAFRESLGLQRQLATADLPGEGQALDRLDAGANNVLAAGARAGTSASSILGLLGKTDEIRRRGLADLGARSDAFHQQQQRGLQGMLQQQAAYQAADRQELDRNKAALKESSERNIYGALDAGSQVAAYGLKDYAGSTGEGGLNSSLIKGIGKKIAAADGPTVDALNVEAARRKQAALYGGMPIYDPYEDLA